MPPVSPCRRLVLVAVAALAAVAATATPALASGAAPGCPAAPTTNPFEPWGDDADYQLAPDGDVEDGAATWSLRGGASVQEGNETFMVASASDHLSLRMPAGSTATTDSMCIGVEHSSFRFFVKRSGGSATFSRLLVEVVVEDTRGRERTLPVGLVSGAGAWAPTSQIPTVVNLLAPLSSNAIDVAFRFRPVGEGTWSIDDVYVDPYRTR